MNYDQGWSGDVNSEDADRATKAKRRKLILIFAAIFVAVIVAGIFFGRKSTPTAPSNSAPTVTVIVPGRTAVAAKVTATGSLSAKRDMPVGVAGEGGMISRVLVDAGDWVRAGETLATVDPAVQAAQTSQMQAQIASAVANAKLAESNLDRAQALVSRGFISKADIDSRTAARDAANASVRLAQAQYREQSARLGRLDIRAPASGFVLARNVEAGQIVSSGSNALFSIAMDGTLEMQAKLAEQDIAGLKVGMPVTVTPVGAGRSFQGAIWQIAPMIDPVSRQGTVRVQLSYDPSLRPGGFATAAFSSQNTEAPVLPESAVLSDDQGNYVYVVDQNDKVQRRAVKIGDVSDAGLAILSGLQGNERVVYSAGAFLNVGEKVVPDLKK
ncbi:efflux RND transporter periplasmic adaptor subunit [Sphingomonas sp. CGMCC 1.13654]|uniref:Efflux RND transporter periplasmic adaptor subunit n=1 Tax=Sphingomonas chungangi TaxID=2683589 RepID=A0A838L588_9SPHN|nr:efflux RND transporter periplasmic adaptor subunit [Sphingomonas chungangi]MBA2932788.1 efflux RND transporter periplasmic adaptor subunit [Sphingomonas chungangi]MVW56410.1 efflux RND transporter periplasmic adaptor subunit [Sphingomonas chungangi]